MKETYIYKPRLLEAIYNIEKEEIERIKYMEDKPEKDVFQYIGRLSAILQFKEIIEEFAGYVEVIDKAVVKEILDDWQEEFCECEHKFKGLREDLLNHEEYMTKQFAEVLKGENNDKSR